MRLGLSLLGVLGGALLGWALSLTQGSHVQHWPWMVVGGVLALSGALITTKLITGRKVSDVETHGPDEQTHRGGVVIHARQMNNGPTGAIIASGPGSFINVVSDNFTNTGIIRTEARELASRAHALSRELYDFLAERRRDDRTLESHLRSSGASDEERRLRWIEDNISNQAFFTETMSRYGQRYATRALAIFDTAAETGLADPKDRWSFEHPTNLIGIEHVAQQLGVFGHKAESGA